MNFLESLGYQQQQNPQASNLALVQASLPKTYSGTPILNRLGVSPVHAAETTGETLGSTAPPNFDYANTGSTAIEQTNPGGGGLPGETTSRLQQLEQTQRNPIQEEEYQNLLKSSGPSAEDILNQGYSAYTAELDAMLNEGLPAQKTAQEGIVGSQYTQGAGELGLQKEEGATLLGKERGRVETGQARNLKDISANLRNAFMAGNVYLGARGAGDSSAANQYSYALTKLGSKQRGDIMTKTSDIMSEIGDREFKLQNIYTSEMNKLGSERDQKIYSISQWFAEQQNNLRGLKAEALKEKSQQLLTYAMNQLNLAQQEVISRRSALEEWALNNATNIQQVKSNLQQVSAYKPNLPQSQPIVGSPITDASGGFRTPAAYYPGSYGTEEEKYLG